MGTRRHGHGTNRRGFTLIELLIVMTVLGVLSAIAIPRLRGATVRAHAAHVIADFATVRMAGLQYFTETSGSLPPTAPTAVVPPELEYLLPDDFEFSYKEITYRWRRWPVPSPNGQTYTAGLELQSSNSDVLTEILQLYQGDFAFGNSNLVVLVI